MARRCSAAVSRPLSHLRVLVVDDLESSRQALCQILESWSYSVVQADSAEAALEIPARSPGGFDVALIDWQMPGADGLELAARIREQAGSPADAGGMLLMIMVTAHALDDVEDLARHHGFPFVAPKPGYFDIFE